MSKTLRGLLPIAAAGLGALAAGCSTPIDEPLSPAFGRAVASMDRQIIDPTPATGLPETSGERAATAVRNLHRGEVKEPYGSYAERMAAGGGGGGESDSSSGSGSSGSTTP